MPIQDEGLLQQNTPATTPPSFPPSLPGEAPQEREDNNQEILDIFVSNGLSIIHEEETSKNLIDSIVKSPDKIEAIANMTLDIVRKLEASAEESGITLPDQVLTQGSNLLMGEIITIAEASGMEPLTDEQKYQTFSLAVSKYLRDNVREGKISPEQLQQMGRDASTTPQGEAIMQQMNQTTPQQQDQRRQEGMISPTTTPGQPIPGRGI